MNYQGLLNDVHRGLGQQMYFWGIDVLSAGNLLKQYGFERRSSPGHQGTSCYSMVWDSGVIELHGHCAGWYPKRPNSESPGYLFVRPHRASYAHDQQKAVVPGNYKTHQTAKEVERLSAASQHFIQWLVEYESWVMQRMGLNYRSQCYRQFKTLPKSKTWLLPEPALRWWRCFASGGAGLKRARAWG